MKDLLIETLEPLGYPILLQGSVEEDEPYPDSLFTYWNNDTNGDTFYDNKENSCIWDFDLNFYSTDPEKVNAVLIEAKQLLEKKGFNVSGKGYDVASDEPTHTGRGINIIIKESGGN